MKFSLSWTLYLALDNARELKLSRVHHIVYKQIVLILSRLSDSAQGNRGSYFQAQASYLSLEQAGVLILGKYVLLGVINTIYKHCHAWVIL